MMIHRIRGAAALLCTLAASCDAAPRDAQAAPARTPAGPAWSAQAPATALSTALGVRSAHTLAAAAADGRGTLHAVFSLDRDGDGWGDALAYARLDSAGWSAPAPLAEGGVLAEAPQVAVEGDGTVHVLWFEHSGLASRPEVPTELVHRALRAGRWSAPVVLYREPHPAGMEDRALAAGTGPDGAVEVLFQPAGRGIGRVTLRGGRAGTPEFLDHDGRMITLASTAHGLPLETAYIGEWTSVLRPQAENDVFVRRLPADGGAPAPVEVHSVPGRHSYYPQLLVDGKGVRHLFWLEDTAGELYPEALFYATSRDGQAWSAARDLTPPGLRGGVLYRVSVVMGADGRIHVGVRHVRGQGQPEGFYSFSLADGVASPLVALAPPGALGPGDARLVADADRVIALWRGADGVYRSATLGG
jgi:hypothetical protein